MSQAGRFISGGVAPGTVLFLEGNSGGIVGPDGGGVIHVIGSGDINIVGNPVTSTLTISLSGAIADVYDADTGSATPALGILNILGGAGIATSAAGNTVTIALAGSGFVESIVGDTGTPISGALTITGGTSGASFDTTGTTITESFNFLALPNTDNPLAQGYISVAGQPILAFYGGLANQNIFLGYLSGNAATTGTQNTAIGYGTLNMLTSGVGNTAVGNIASPFMTSGSFNTSLGIGALNQCTDSNFNVAIGQGALNILASTGGGDGNNTALGAGALSGIASGVNNIAIGINAGSLLNLADSSNILIGTQSASGTSNAIIIGTQGVGTGQQSTCNIAGIYGSTIGATNALVFIDNTGQLGTTGGPFSAVTSITGDSGPALTGNIFLTGGTSGAVFLNTAGTTLTEEFRYLAMNDTSATTGYIQIGANKVLQCGGGVASGNFFAGSLSGNTTLSGTLNIGIGQTTLVNLTSGGSNSVLGTTAANGLTTGSQNVAIGVAALNAATSDSTNVAIGNGAMQILNTSLGGNTGVGYQALKQSATGTQNIALGYNSGFNYTAAESSNIIIGNTGTAAESNVIRIGTQGSGSGQHNTAYMAGITGSAVGATNAIVYCDNTGKLGTTGGTFPSLGTTNHAVQVGNVSGGLTSLAVGTNGQVLVGSTGADPIFATLGSNGSLSYTAGAGTLSIAIAAPVSIANGGTNATSMATTDGTIYYDGTRLVTTATGTTGQVLTSGGAGVAPTYQSGSAIPLGTTNHAVQVGNASGTLTSLAVGTNGQVLLGSTGVNPVFAALASSGGSITYTTGAGTLNLDLTAPVSIANGGTNATSMANTFGVNYYDGTRLVTTTVGTAAQVLTSNGAGVAPTFQSLPGGGVTSITGDAGGALTGAITVTGGSSGAVYTGSGGNTLTTTFTKLVMSDTTATTGYIQIGAQKVLAAWGGVAGGQIFVGEGSGNTTLSGIQNAALGGATLAALTSGGANAAVGYHALTACTTGSDNVAVGEISLATLTTGSRNVALGQAALDVLATGSDNIAVGEGAGSNYSGAESSNILIGDSGVLAESNVIRIGTQGSGAGQQNTAYIAGITGSSVGVTNAIVYCDNTGKLGTTGGTFPSLGTTNHAVQVGNVSGGLTSLTVGTNGQVLVGSTGANPVFATLTSTGSSITYTTGAGTLNLDLTAPVSIANGGTNATSMANTFGVNYYDGTRLVTTTVGTSGQVLTSNGAGVAPTFQAAVSGATSFPTSSGTATPSAGALTIAQGSNILTTGASSTVTIALVSSPSVSGSLTAGTTITATAGAITATAGDVVITAGNLTLPNTTSTTGIIKFGGNNFIHNLGSSNTFVGASAGNLTLTTGSAINNTAVGTNALTAITTSTNNVAIGTSALVAATSGNGSNVAIGQAALNKITTGVSNIGIGKGAGSSYGGTEGSNILINNAGVASESNAIHIGTQGSSAGQQNACFIAGIAGVTIANTAAVLISTVTGQLGTTVSSRRFKENIDDMGAISRDLHKLRPVKFNFKGDYNESYGLIAEDVEEVMPYLVSYDSEGLPATVKYHELPALLLNEIQRLKLKIDELESKFNARVRP